MFDEPPFLIKARTTVRGSTTFVTLCRTEIADMDHTTAVKSNRGKKTKPGTNTISRSLALSEACLMFN